MDFRRIGQLARSASSCPEIWTDAPWHGALRTVERQARGITRGETRMNTPNPEFKFGDGRISGVTSLALGLLSIPAVLCLRFPSLLTTPELRPHYDMDFLRLTLSLAMGCAVFLGFVTFVINRRKRLGAAGICAVLLALLLGGPYVPYRDFTQGPNYIGLDWLVGPVFHRLGLYPARTDLSPRR